MMNVLSELHSYHLLLASLPHFVGSDKLHFNKFTVVMAVVVISGIPDIL